MTFRFLKYGVSFSKTSLAKTISFRNSFSLAIPASIVKYYGVQPQSAKNYTDLYRYKKGVDRRIYLDGALDSPCTINANDPRPKWATISLSRLLRHLTVPRNDTGIVETRKTHRRVAVE